ncbi:unnamed protein product [Arabis nemorensis]|uniref:Uncharacterized protein n=1 Tax=Arabis nemorensis TaxID=586526 RepID=A0A565C7N6_9BRAS|nr:unnamed protein product [Arabis nemorensis]
MAASDEKSPEESECYHFMQIKSLAPLLCIEDHVKEIVPLNFLEIVNHPADSPYFSSDVFRASIISTVVETLRGFVEINEGLSSFPEIFTPISTLLHQVGNQEKIPQTLKDKLKYVAQLIEKKTDEHRKQHKPPKFEDDYVKGRYYDPDKYSKDSNSMSEVKAKENAVQGAFKSRQRGKERAGKAPAFKSGQLGKGRRGKERAEKPGKAPAFKSGQLGKGRRGKKRKR